MFLFLKCMYMHTYAHTLPCIFRMGLDRAYMVNGVLIRRGIGEDFKNV